MKVSIITLGCKLNQYESEALAESFRKADIAIASDMEEADAVVVNTCTVTNRADSKSRKVMRDAKRAGKTVVVTGCYATTDYESLSEDISADIVVKNEHKFTIADILKNAPAPKESSLFPTVTRFGRTRATVKIQDGCDKFCSYCKIPHARGRSVSLAPEAILRNVESLIEGGYKEIVLTGVNISDYRAESGRLSWLVGQIISLPGDFRLRLSSLQPDEFELSMIDHLANPKMDRHFHLSLQSGSDTVLARMERHYTAADFLSIVDSIRTACPDSGISTDIITGFPGESESEFKETLSLVEKATFTRVHLFPYSVRSHTKAARLPDMDEKIKKERLKILEAAYLRKATIFVEQKILGKPQRVLIEEKEGDFYTGYTGNYFQFFVSKPCELNTFVEAVPTRYRIDKGAIELLE